MNRRVWGLAVAALVVVLDQLAKAAAERWLAGGGLAPTPFLDLVLAHNKGISFSILANAPQAAHWALIAFTLAASAAILLWLLRARSLLGALGLGAILGGALGNGLDRLWSGSVIDFLDLHLGDWHFFVFNLADAAISLGVAFLLWDGAFGADAPAAAGNRAS